MEEFLRFIKPFVIGIAIIVIVIYIAIFVSSITLFEDGSFTGCLPFALCGL